MVVADQRGNALETPPRRCFLDRRNRRTIGQRFIKEAKLGFAQGL